MVADVGGTNTRIALFDPATREFRALATYRNRDFNRFEDVIERWLGELDEAAPDHGCIAVAAPPGADRVAMINIDWSFSCRDLATQFGFQRLGWINDFEGNAHALPHLGEQDRQALHLGRDGSAGKLATLGPGTGLGGATLEWVSGQPHACPCEPGHMGLSPATQLEVELFGHLLQRHGDIFAELLVSGPGLKRLYHALGEINAQPTRELKPADISRLGMAAEDPLCEEALQVFCGLLGSICGDFVLATGAYGGLYLAGGIIPRMIPFLEASSFQQRFRDKGAMQDHLQAVPVYAITTAQPGLIGAAHAPL